MDYCGLLIVEKNSIANLKLNLPGGVAESTVSRAGGSFGDGWQLAKRHRYDIVGTEGTLFLNRWQDGTKF